MPLISANGLQLRCETRGNPAGPTLLLVMGLGMPAALWTEAFLRGLEERGFHLVLFDNRDSGGSTRLAGVRGINPLHAISRALLRRKVPSPYDLDDMAADTAGLLDALGIGRAHVVGASMGGMIGQMLAARFPERVQTLVSIMSSSGNPQRRIAFGERRALRAILKPPPPADDIPAMVEHLIRTFSVIGSPRYPMDPTEMRPHFERVARCGLYREGTERQLLAVLGSGDRRALLRNIRAPTLVIHGSADPLVPLAAGLDTAEHIPDARMEVVMGMGHDIPNALARRIAQRIGEHCSDHPLELQAPVQASSAPGTQTAPG